ncbi:MAG: transposase [Methylococcaceae bacterium]|nr:transposase [Methylococcaceae bacterium]
MLRLAQHERFKHFRAGSIAEACSGFNWVCHAYCLMSNHDHIVIETIEGNFTNAIYHLNGVNTQDINRRHNRAGHVYQERYKAVLVEWTLICRSYRV